MGIGLIKGLGILVTVAGAGLGILGSYVEDKKMEQKVKDEVSKQLTDKQKSDEKTK